MKKNICHTTLYACSRLACALLLCMLITSCFTMETAIIKDELFIDSAVDYDVAGLPPIYQAIYAEDIEALKTLVTKQNINEYYGESLGPFSWFYNPLIFAAAVNKPASVSFLISKGAIVNASDYYDRKDQFERVYPKNTALHYASAQGFPEVLEILLANGAKVDGINFDGVTPLMMACGGPMGGGNVRACNLSGMAAAVKILAKNKAQLEAQGLLPNVPFLKTPLPPDAPSGWLQSMPVYGSHQTALMYAASSNLIQSAQALIESGAKVDTQDFLAKRTALHFAVLAKNAGIVTLLLDNNAKIDPISNDGIMPLMFAAQGLDSVIMKILLDRGAHIHTYIPSSGQNLLIAVINQADPRVQKISLDLMKMLIERGIDINFQSSPGKWTALMMASGLGGLQKSTEKIDYLLSQGANPNLQNANGETALYMAAYQGAVEIGKTLLASQADPNIAAVNGRTPLMAAAAAIPDYQLIKSEYPAFVELLLNNGAAVNVKDTNNRTALSFAKKYGSEKSQSLIAAQGGTVDSKEIPEQSEKTIIGTWGGKNDQFIYTWKFNADKTWSYSVEFAPEVLRLMASVDRDAANKSLQSTENGSGAYALRDEYIILNQGSLFARAIGWQFTKDTLYLNGIQWMCKKK